MRMPSDAFFAELVNVAARPDVGMQPEHVLRVLFLESALDPASPHHDATFTGMNQSTTAIRRAAGIPDDVNARWRELGDAEQLHWIGNVIALQRKMGGGAPFESPAEYMGAQLAPAHMHAQRTSELVIWQKSDGAPYEQNKNLDVDHDGRITLGDLDRFFAGLAQRADYAPIAAKVPRSQMPSGGGSSPGGFPVALCLGAGAVALAAAKGGRR